ncbi:hypothetical protein APSETT445_004865 [Aspergillus pseudonomiae]
MSNSEASLEIFRPRSAELPSNPREDADIDDTIRRLARQLDELKLKKQNSHGKEKLLRNLDGEDRIFWDQQRDDKLLDGCTGLIF